MRALSFLIAFILCSAAHAQDASKFAKKAVKGYLNYSWANKFETNVLVGGYSPYFDQADVNYHTISRVTPAISIRGDDGFNEIEVLNILMVKNRDISQYSSDGINIIDLPHKTFIFDISLRYEYAFKVFRQKQRRFEPYIGFAVTPGYEVFKSTTEFPDLRLDYYRHQEISIQLAAVPRLVMNIGKRFLVDLNTPLNVMDVSTVLEKGKASYSRTYHKSFSLVERRGFPNIISARLGFGVKF